MSKFVIKVSTTAPTDGNSVTLFDSTVAFGRGVMRYLPITRVAFTTNNSHTGTLVAKRSIDGGTTWTTYDSRAVGVPAANTISGPYDFLIDTFLEWQLIWTNGGTTQTTWTPEMVGFEGDRVPGT
jgi:hypothetical protein